MVACHARRWLSPNSCDQINSFISKTCEWNVSPMITLYLCPVRLLRSWHRLRTQQRQHLHDEVGTWQNKANQKTTNCQYQNHCQFHEDYQFSESQTDKHFTQHQLAKSLCLMVLLYLCPISFLRPWHLLRTQCGATAACAR